MATWRVTNLQLEDLLLQLRDRGVARQGLTIDVTDPNNPRLDDAQQQPVDPETVADQIRATVAPWGRAH